MSMEDRLRNVLRKCSFDFRRDLTEVVTVCEILYGWNIITEEMKERVLSHRTIHDQASALHKLVPTRGEKAFVPYYLALRQANEDALADILEPHVPPDERVVKDAVPSEVKTGHVTHVQESGDMGDDPDLPDNWPDLSYEPLNIKVKKCDTSNHVMKKCFEQSTMVYSMKGKRTGVKVLIINNKEFEKPAQDTNEELPKRHGTDIDATCLDILFEQLGYKDVKTEHNLNGQAILEAIRSAAADCQVTDNAFICVILSHGNAGHVYGKDGVPVNLESIYELLDGAHCPNLVGKPKVFIIQACQGSKKDRVGQYAQAAPPRDVDLNYVQDQLKSLNISQESTDASTKGLVPVKADMLVATATTPEYVSWRNPDGSWFIQAFVYVIQHHAHKYDLLKLLTLTNNLVSKRLTQDQKHKQISSKSDTFTKDFYFFPGFEDEDDFFSL